MRLWLLLQIHQIHDTNLFVNFYSFFLFYSFLYSVRLNSGRSQWPRGLRRRSAAARMLRSWVRIPPGAWIFVYCECCVLSGRGLCVKLITCPEEYYRMWCVVVCDLENLKNEEVMTRVGSQRHRKKIPLQTWTVPEGSKRMRLLDFWTIDT